MCRETDLRRLFASFKQEPGWRVCALTTCLFAYVSVPRVTRSFHSYESLSWLQETAALRYTTWQSFRDTLFWALSCSGNPSVINWPFLNVCMIACLSLWLFVSAVMRLSAWPLAAVLHMGLPARPCPWPYLLTLLIRPHSVLLWGSNE